MEIVLTIAAILVALLALAMVVRRQVTNAVDSRARVRLKSEILALCDDITTNPNGLSLQDAVELLEVKMIVEIVDELKKMPPGSRSLQRAIEITGDESYGRAA